MRARRNTVSLLILMAIATSVKKASTSKKDSACQTTATSSKKESAKSANPGDFLGLRTQTDDGSDSTIKGDLEQLTLVCTKYSFHFNCSKLSVSKDECIECSRQYSLTANKTCVQTLIPENCKHVHTHPQTSQCIECFKGFDLDSENAYLPDNCQQYDEQLRCTRCKYEFALDRVTCEYLKKSNCLITEENRCTLCREGYYSNEDSGHTCYQVKRVDDCTRYKQNQNLYEQCRDSFTFHDQKCILSINYFRDYYYY